MTPALAQPSVLVCAVTRALTVPSPGSGCETNRNWSLVPQMSPPPPCTVHVPPFSDWVPAGVAPPTSAHVHPLGHAPGGGGALLVRPTASNVTVLSASVSCDVTARPPSMPPLRPSVTVEPATGVHVLPSLDVYAVNVAPDRATRT